MTTNLQDRHLHKVAVLCIIAIFNGRAILSKWADHRFTAGCHVHDCIEVCFERGVFRLKSKMAGTTYASPLSFHTSPLIMMPR